MQSESERRGFIRRLLGWGGGATAAALAAQPSPAQAVPSNRPNPSGLSQLYQTRTGRRRRESSWNRSGANADRYVVDPGATHTLAEIQGAGCVRHIWITINSPEQDYLRKLVLRAYWDGSDEPSVETPVGDFFGVGHGRVSNYWSLPLNMVTGGQPESQSRAAMNCFFPMPFERGARITVENQGEEPVAALYYYVDYETYAALPGDALRFHAWWRRENPTPARIDLGSGPSSFRRTNELINLDGRDNYLVLDVEGRGHFVGCVLSIDHVNPIPNFGWFGEGDDFFWIDGEEKPSLMGTGTEDYFCQAWGYPGGFNSMPYHGISYPVNPSEGTTRYSGKWTMFRFHVEDPIMFERSLRFSIEHGHANVHANDYSSVAYWYQTLPHKPFPKLAAAHERLPIPDVEGLRRYWKTF